MVKFLSSLDSLFQSSSVFRMWNMYFSICNENMVRKLNKMQSYEYSNLSSLYSMLNQSSNILTINMYPNYFNTYHASRNEGYKNMNLILMP